MLEFVMKIKGMEEASPAFGKFTMETLQKSPLFQSIGRSISLRRRNEVCESCRADDWVCGLDPLNASGIELLQEMGYPAGVAFLCEGCLHHQFEAPGNVRLEEGIGVHIVSGALELLKLDVKLETGGVSGPNLPAEPSRYDYA